MSWEWWNDVTENWKKKKRVFTKYYYISQSKVIEMSWPLNRYLVCINISQGKIFSENSNRYSWFSIGSRENIYKELLGKQSFLTSVNNHQVQGFPLNATHEPDLVHATGCKQPSLKSITMLTFLRKHDFGLGPPNVEFCSNMFTALSEINHANKRKDATSQTHAHTLSANSLGMSKSFPCLRLFRHKISFYS
jgi:hypothetical protein